MLLHDGHLPGFFDRTRSLNTNPQSAHSDGTIVKTPVLAIWSRWPFASRSEIPTSREMLLTDNFLPSSKPIMDCRIVSILSWGIFSFMS